MNVKKMILAGWLNSSTPAYVYSTQYQAVMDWAAVDPATRGIPPTSLLDRIREDVFIRGLVTANIFQTCDQFAWMGASFGDKNWNLINLVSPGTRNLFIVGNMFFTPGLGFTTQALTTAYIRTNFIPATHAVNWTQNNAGFVYDCPVSDIGISEESLGSGGAANLHAINLNIRNGSNNLTVRINEATAVTIANATSAGLYHARRTASNALAVYKNGASIGTSTQASTGLSTIEITLSAFNANGTPGTNARKYGRLWMIGASWLGLEATIDTLWDTYLAALPTQSVTLPTFPDRLTYSNDLSAYLAALAACDAAVDPEGVPVVQYIPGTVTIVTTQEYQGLIPAPNGFLYGTVSSGTTILKITPSTGACTEFGSISVQNVKYGSGCLIGTKIYFCPMNATSVLVLETNDDTITYFDIAGAETTAMSGDLTGADKWWGFCLGSDGFIYGIAFMATEVIRINPATNAITFLDKTGLVAFGAGDLIGSGKWDGGTSYGNYVFGSPSGKGTALKIDIAGLICTEVGTFLAGGNRYSYPIVLKNGKILFAGYGETDVKIFDPSDNSVTTATGTFSGSAAYCLGGTNFIDGRVLLSGGGASKMYIYDPDTNVLAPFGDTLITQTELGAKLTADGSIIIGPSTGSVIYKVYYPKKIVTVSYDFLLSRYMSYF